MERRTGLRKAGTSVASAFVPDKLKPLVEIGKAEDIALGVNAQPEYSSVCIVEICGYLVYFQNFAIIETGISQVVDIR